MESRGHSHISYLFAATITFVSTSAVAAPEITPSIALEIYMRETYPRLWNHKAVAIGPAGVFASSYRATDASTAKQRAKKRCEERLKWHPVHAFRNAKCRLYAVGETVVFKNALAGPKSRTVKQQTIRKPLSSKPRARMIFLSDCGHRGRIARNENWYAGWFDLLAVHGFEVVAPAHEGTGLKCVKSAWANDAVVRTRRNAVRAIINTVEKTDPSLPVYVWGDGAGAAVALTLDRRVRGIITTGHPCTYAQTSAVLVHPDARLLVLMGEKQAGLDIASRRVGVHDVAKFCTTALRDKNHRAVVINGMTARAEMSRTAVRREVSRFFQVAIPKLEASQPESIKMLGYEALMRFNVAYRLFSNHKAVVLGPDEKDYVSVARDSADEAVQAALFDCNRDQSGNGFVTTPDTVCVLFVRDDDIVLPQLMEPVAEE